MDEKNNTTSTADDKENLEFPEVTETEVGAVEAVRTEATKTETSAGATESAAKREKTKKPDPNKKTWAQSFTEWRKGCVGEFRKIVWPSRAELLKKTFTVVVTSLIIAGVIVAMDAVFRTSLSGLVGMLTK